MPGRGRPWCRSRCWGGHDHRLWRVLLRLRRADRADQRRYALAGRGARRDLQRDLVITGAGGIVAGRVLDRRGPRPIFLLAAIAGAGAMLLASAQGALLPFAIAYAGGCGLVGALGFYHITQAVAARAAPAAPARAIIWLTLFGAFSSPVYLPLTAWLIQSAGWRGAIRIEAGTVRVAFLLAAVLIRTRAAPGPAGQPTARPGAPGRLAEARRCGPGWPPPWPAAPRSNALIVYQVPVTDQGRAAARRRGGRRRVPRPGPAGRAAAAHRPDQQARDPQHPGPRLHPRRRRHAAAVRGGALAPALVLSLFAGAAIGAVYSLQGVYAHELTDPRHLGLLLGVAGRLRRGRRPGPRSLRAPCWAPPAPTPRRSRSSAPDSPPPRPAPPRRAPGRAAPSDSAAGQDRR